MTANGQTPILTLKNIHKSYGPVKVLHGIDLDVNAGEVVALLGENGAGKSTVSNVISGAILPTSGEMTWLGATFAPATPREAIDAGIGMIHQELMLLPPCIDRRERLCRTLPDKARPRRPERDGNPRPARPRTPRSRCLTEARCGRAFDREPAAH